MDAWKKWMIIRFTPYYATTLPKWILKTFVQIILAAKWLVRPSNTSPHQQRRPLPSLLSLSYDPPYLPRMRIFQFLAYWSSSRPPLFQLIKRSLISVQYLYPYWCQRGLLNHKVTHWWGPLLQLCFIVEKSFGGKYYQCFMYLLNYKKNYRVRLSL